MLLLISSSTLANSSDKTSQLYVESLLHASTTPVSIDSFIDDWQGSLKKGDYAFADGRLRTGVVLNGWEVAVEKRWHYDLRFSPDTAKLYYNIEHKRPDEQEYQLSLNAKILHAEGVSFAKELNFQQFSFKPVITLYRSDFYQFGQLSGRASGDIANKENIAVEVDLENYHFSEDKLLEDPRLGGQGQGVSVGFSAEYQNDLWKVAAISDDFYNRWQFQDAVYLNGKVCVYLAGGSGNCSGGGGKDGVETYQDRLSSSWTTEVTYKPYALSVNSFTHGRYQRLGVQKDWFTQVGMLGASVYSTKQLGLHWQSQWHRLAVILDQPELKKVRHAQVDLAITVPW